MGTRVRTNKGDKKGCRNKALSVTLLVVVLCGVLMGASKCPVRGDETCEIVARDTTSLTTKCTDEDGKDTGNGERKDIPSDLYPLCQVGTFWPGCKTAR